MERLSPKSIKHDAAVWLRQGMSPQRLALTLALGFAIGCIPVVGIPTVLCAGLALTLRLESAGNPGGQLPGHAVAAGHDCAVCSDGRVAARFRIGAYTLDPGRS